MNPNDRDMALERELHNLRMQYESLKESKVRTEQDIANLSRQLQELEARALAEYGTADPGELQKLLDTKRAENEKLVADYRDHISKIHNDLQAVENNLDPAE